MLAELAPGSTFAGYRIDGVVARGGMGVVYRAYDVGLERPVALKLIAPELAEDARFRERFLRETRIAASLEHPHVLPVHAAGEVEGTLYLVTRFVEGEDLKSRLAEGRLEPKEALRIVGEVAEALDAAHERGLVHRDVKPGNILLGRNGEAYLADFGLTKSVGSESALTKTGELLGTLDYLAPEQIRGGPVDGRADQYSLACVLFECLAGGLPFARDQEAQVLWAHMHEPPPGLRAARAELPETIDTVIARALAKEPGERYPTCVELVKEAGSALGLGSPAVAARRLRRGRLLAACGALLVAGAVAAGVIKMTNGGPAPIAIAAGDGLALIDPATSALAAVMALPDRPAQVVAVEGRLWVAGDGTVSAVDPDSRQIVAVVATDARATDLAAGEGALWLLDGESGVLVRIDPVYAVVTDRIELPRATETEGGGRTPAAVAAGEGGVWVVDGSSILLRIDPAAGEVAAEVDLGHELNGVAVGAGSVWAISGPDATVVEVDPEKNAVVAEIVLAALPGSASPFPIAVAVGEGSVWILNGNTATLTRIDPELRGVTATIPIGVGRNPAALVPGGGAIWVANAADGTVARVDAGTQAVTSVLVGANPADVAVADGGVWVGVEAGLGRPVVDATAIVEASTPEGALPASFCSPVYSPRGQEPRYLIVSDFPLQGNLSQLTAQMSEAIRFVLADHGYRAGDHTVGYQSCETADAQIGFSTSEKCRGNATAYAEHPKVLGIIGSFDSVCSEVEIPIANAAPAGPLAMISPSNTSAGLTRAGPGAAPGKLEGLYPSGERNYARVLPADDYQAAANALLAQRLGIHSVYILTAGAPYGPGLADAFERAAAHLGIAIAGRKDYESAASGYAELAASVASTGVDGVLLAGYRETDLVRDLRAALGSAVRILAPDGFLPIADIVAEAGLAAEGMTVSAPGIPPERLTGAGKEFVAAFGQAIGAPVEPFAFYAAAATEILLDAIARSDGTRASVTANLLATRLEGGILGDVAFDENGDIASKAVTIYEIKGGKPTILDVITPPADLVAP